MFTCTPIFSTFWLDFLNQARIEHFLTELCGMCWLISRVWGAFFGHLENWGFYISFYCHSHLQRRTISSQGRMVPLHHRTQFTPPPKKTCGTFRSFLSILHRWTLSGSPSPLTAARLLCTAPERMARRNIIMQKFEKVAPQQEQLQFCRRAKEKEGNSLTAWRCCNLNVLTAARKQEL